MTSFKERKSLLIKLRVRYTKEANRYSIHEYVFYEVVQNIARLFYLKGGEKMGKMLKFFIIFVGVLSGITLISDIVLHEYVRAIADAMFVIGSVIVYKNVTVVPDTNKVSLNLPDWFSWYLIVFGILVSYNSIVNANIAYLAHNMISMSFSIGIVVVWVGIIVTLLYVKLYKLRNK